MIVAETSFDERFLALGLEIPEDFIRSSVRLNLVIF